MATESNGNKSVHLLRWVAWGTTILLMIISGWGGYKVLTYRVDELGKDHHQLSGDFRDEKERVWNRLESDHEERDINEKAIIETQHSIKAIEVSQKGMAENIKTLVERSHK